MPTLAFFDAETTGVDANAKINCASVLTVEPDGTKSFVTYHSGSGRPLSVAMGKKLLDQLCSTDTVVTWNGAAFDWRLLWQLTGDRRAIEAAKRNPDLMLQFTAANGYWSSMQSFAAGSLDAGKTNTGAWAATAWADPAQTEKVIEYCEADCEVLYNLYTRGLAAGMLTRITGAGKSRPWVLSSDPSPAMYLPAETAFRQWQASKPDTRWMTDPPDMKKMLAWWGD